MKTVATDAAPSRPQQFSQAVVADGFVFVSGQLPLRADGTLVGGDIEAQTAQVLENVGAILAAAGASFADVVKVLVFVADLDEFGRFNDVYGRWFTGTKPARSTVQVARLAFDAKVEIEVVARLP